MRIALILCTINFACFSADTQEELFQAIKKESVSIEATYKQIKRNSSPQYKEFESSIDSGDADFDGISEYYTGVLEKIAQLKRYRVRVDWWNQHARSVNDMLDGKQQKVVTGAKRQAALADIEAQKSTITTELNDKNRTAWVTNPDGTISRVNSSESGVATRVSRENQAISGERARLEKEGIREKALDEQAEIETQKLNGIECPITAAQLNLLEKNEKTKFRYLMKKQK